MPGFLIRILILLSVSFSASNLFAAECEHVFSNNWGSGFQAEIQITNTGTTPITSFTVTWKLQAQAGFLVWLRAQPGVSV